MANLLQNIAAFFDPTVAVNKNGDLVEADGFFDRGDYSTDYIDAENLSPARDFFYGTGSSFDKSYVEGFLDSSDISVSEPSDTSFSEVPYGQELFDQVQDSVNKQNEASQSSADKAMEFEAEQARLNREFQAEQAQKAMDYQTEMSNTAFQRAMADLKAAGINPKMVAQLGSASTPSGIAASGSTARGYTGNMSMANTAALSGLLQTYITSASALDRQNNSFVQNIIFDLIELAL